MSALETSAPQHRAIREDITKVPTLTIIIASYNARGVPADCPQSIYQNPTIEPYEILVVDDASADRTSEMVRALFPELRFE